MTLGSLATKTAKEGVKINNGAALNMGFFVSTDVPPYAIVGGNPAKIIKYRVKEEQLKNYRKSRGGIGLMRKLLNSLL